MIRRKNDIATDWLPIGWTIDQLQRTDSVLWNDGTALHDLSVMIPMANHGFPSPVEGAKEASVERMLKNIHRKEWQDKHPLRSFALCYHYALQVRPSDIKSVIYAQAVEILCYIYYPNFETQDFAEKIKRVFKYIYNEEMSHRAAQMLRIMRNNTAHLADVTNTGRLHEIAMQEVNQFSSDHYKGDVSRMFFSFSAAFNDLVEDMILRILDGEIEDVLKYNITAYMMLRKGGMD